MLSFLLQLVFLALTFPLAVLGAVLYGVLWVLLLPFRVLGIGVEGVLETVRAVVLLPSRVLGGGRKRRD